jgi:hypothetical protein
MNGSCGPIESVPLDLIGILYVNDPSSNDASVLCANLDDGAGNDLFFKYTYNDTGTVLSFRIRNFKQPHIARVEFVGQSLQSLVEAIPIVTI